jgi:hypothetical protein
VPESSDGESDAESSADGDESGADEDGNTESASAMDVDDEYLKFKAMGDADHAQVFLQT